VNNFESAQSIWRKIYPDGHPNEALDPRQPGANLQNGMHDYKGIHWVYEKHWLFIKNRMVINILTSHRLHQTGNIKLSENKFPEAWRIFSRPSVPIPHRLMRKRHAKILLCWLL